MKSMRAGVIAAAVVLLALTGCGNLFKAQKVDYKSAGKGKPLEVPPDLTQPGTDERYIVPDTNPQGTATYSDYARDRATQPKAPLQSGVLPDGDGVTVQRAGTERWLVVRAEPAELWPTVKEFWLESGFILDKENPETGVMETDWAENRAKIPQDGIRMLLGKVIDGLYSTPERDKFRTRLERGQQPGTTEIYVSHRGVYEVYPDEGKDKTVWQPRPPDPELEAEMLQRLMVRLGVQEARAKAEVAAPPPVLRAQMTKTRDGASALVLNDSFERAWRRVGLALDRVGFTVEDRDRQQGLYFVRYVDAKEDAKTTSTGILSRLKFWGDGKTAPAAQYRIQIEDRDPGSSVTVVSKDGQPERSDTATRIIALLYEQLK